MKKIGLFGGSFNPIHNGHIELAKAIYHSFHLNEIIFIPAHISPLKEPSKLASREHRLKMLELAIKEEDYPFHISTYELDKGDPSFTLNTAKHFVKNNADKHYFLMLGEDCIQTFKAWHNYEELLSSIDIIVFPRSSKTSNCITKYFPQFTKIAKTHNITVFETTNNHELFFFKHPILRISSTQVRQLTSKQLSHTNLISRQVKQYIKNHNLYLD